MTTKKQKYMSKKEWLGQRVARDLYGRPYNLSDVPMTYMTRYKSFKKQGASDKEINDFYYTRPESTLIKYRAPEGSVDNGQGMIL